MARIFSNQALHKKDLLHHQKRLTHHQCGRIKDVINVVPMAITTENVITIKANGKVEKFNNNCWVNGILLLYQLSKKTIPNLVMSEFS